MIDKKNAARLGISAAVIVFIFLFIDINMFLRSIYLIDARYVALVVMLIPISILVRAVKFCMIINKDGKLISLWDSYRLVMVSLSLNIIMPASLGDIAKAYYGYKRHRIKEAMVSSSVIDKLAGITGILVIGAAGSLILRLYWLFVPMTALLAVFYVLTFYPSFLRWGFLNRILNSMFKKSLDVEKIFQSYEMGMKLRLWILALSVLGWIVTYIQFYLVVAAFSVDVGFLYLLAVSPLITFAKLFPVTLLGLGSQEVVAIYLFGLVGISPTESTLVSLFSTILYRILPGILGIAFILRDGRSGQP